MRNKKLYAKLGSIYEIILNLFLYPIITCYYTSYNKIKELPRIGQVMFDIFSYIRPSFINNYKLL